MCVRVFPDKSGIESVGSVKQMSPPCGWASSNLLKGPTEPQAEEELALYSGCFQSRQKVVTMCGDGFAPLMDDINRAGTRCVPPPLLLAPLAGETQVGLLPLHLPDAAGGDARV